VNLLSREVAARIRLVVLDADGVLTDGGIYLGDGSGCEGEWCRFHVRDGVGVHLLQQVGIEVAIVSGRVSPAVRLRGGQLGIAEIRQVSPRGKRAAVDEILAEREIGWEETACLADDLADLALVRRAGLGGAVADAVPEVRRAASWCGAVKGGAGAVREFAEALLRARGEWVDVVHAYVGEGERTT